MNTLTKLAIGMIGNLKGQVPQGESTPRLLLPSVDMSQGRPLMQVLSERSSQREFAATPLPLSSLSELLWAAAGINRPSLGGRTAPSALNAQEIDVYVALAEGLYRYDPHDHVLLLIQAYDIRRVTGYQDFVDTAALDLVFVADHSRLKLVPASQREAYAFTAAGAMAQNVYLYCASVHLATVIRAWIDRDSLANAIGLGADHQVLLAQTVGFPSGKS